MSVLRGALALEAAASGRPIDRVAVYELLYLLGDSMLAAWRACREDLDAALEVGACDEALRLFMRLAGSDDEQIAAAEAAQVWHGCDRSHRRPAKTRPASATDHSTPLASAR